MPPKPWEERKSHLHRWASWWAAPAKCNDKEGIGAVGWVCTDEPGRSGKGVLQNNSSPLFKVSGSRKDKVAPRNWARRRETRET